MLGWISLVNPEVRAVLEAGLHHHSPRSQVLVRLHTHIEVGLGPSGVGQETLVPHLLPGSYGANFQPALLHEVRRLQQRELQHRSDLLAVEAVLVETVGVLAQDDDGIVEKRALGSGRRFLGRTARFGPFHRIVGDVPLLVHHA